MGTDIHGWVEVRPTWANEDEEWLEVIWAGILLNRSYDTFCRLFGVRMSEEESVVPIAAHRGLPANISPTVRKWAVPDEDDEPHLDGWVGFHSSTWIGWTEIQALDWSEFGEDYQRLFRLMQIIADSGQFPEMRLVVWFDN